MHSLDIPKAGNRDKRGLSEYLKRNIKRMVVMQTDGTWENDRIGWKRQETMKKSSMRKAAIRLLGLLATISLAPAALAEVDLSGDWMISYHEDWIELGTGPDIADFAGMPVTEPARQRALSYHASQVNMPEHQCLPLPIEYADLWSNTRIWKEVDEDSQQVVAWRIRKDWGGTDRYIWMDDRPRPSAHAPHTFQGFSKGEWEGNTLKVTTTHLKEGYARRNGVPRSDQATVVEHFMVLDDRLTVSVITQDPMYLSELWIRSANYERSITRQIRPYPCEVVTELASMKRGYVPHYFPWKNPFLEEFSKTYGIPLDTSMGHPEQMYPSFIEK